MAFKAIAYFAAMALLVQNCFLIASSSSSQTVCSQQCGCGLSNQVVSNSLGGNLGYNPSFSSVGVGSSNLGLPNVFSQGQDALSIAVGSSYAPSGISLVADNLELGGQLLISGQYPILGTVSVAGDIPTGGQGQVQYNTASGVSLASGGCGYGQPSSVQSVGYGNSGLVGSSGLGVVSNGLGVLGRGGCGCL